jgi:hypothetical protein
MKNYKMYAKNRKMGKIYVSSKLRLLLKVFLDIAIRMTNVNLPHIIRSAVKHSTAELLRITW